MYYRRKASIRLSGYDYSRNGLYFVTSCVKDRLCHFGEVLAGKMVLNEFGQIANDQWHWMVNRYPYIASHAFVVMPNHFHGILILEKDFNNPQPDNHSPLVKKATPGKTRFQNQGSGSLSSIMGSFKSAVTKKSKLIRSDFGWLPRFHEHIIRNEKAFENITRYIIENPSKWKEDKLFHEE